MEKVGFILDSFCGLTKKEVEAKGYHYLPLVAIYDGKEYLAGVDINAEQAVNMLTRTKNTRTSMPSPGNVKMMFEKTSELYEQVFYVAFSSHLSSTFASAHNMADEYPRVHVIDSVATGVATFTVIEGIKKMIDKKTTISSIKTSIKNFMKQCFTVIVPKTMESLYKGGRVGRASQIVLDRLKVIPILQFDFKGFNRKSWKRTQKKAIIKATDMLKALSNKVKNFKLGIIHSGDHKVVDYLLGVMSRSFLVQHKDISVELCSPIIAVHTGFSTVGLFVYPDQL